MRVLIVSGGEYAPAPDLFCDYVIACDRGYLHAEKMGIRPDLILGDFDSAPVPEPDIPVEKHPKRKDDTDTMLALRKALALGAAEIVVACAFGGRLDHSFANIQAGAYAAEKGALARLCGVETDAWIFRDRTVRFQRRAGYSLSVFSVTDSCLLTIRGAEYDCSDLLVANSFPIGISNEWAGDEIAVSGKEGVAMVMECRIGEP